MVRSRASLRLQTSVADGSLALHRACYLAVTCGRPWRRRAAGR